MAKARPDLKRKIEKKFSRSQSDRIHHRRGQVTHTVRLMRSLGEALAYCGLGTCGPAGTGVGGAFGLGLATGPWLVAGASRIEDSLRP